MLEDYKEYIYHCLKCGACRSAFRVYGPTCPSGERFGFDSYYAIGRLGIARAVLEDRLKLTDKTAQRVFTCASCGACDEQCYPAMGLKPLEVIEELKAIMVEEGVVPPKVRDFLENVYKYGNPYGEGKEKRGKWAEGTSIRQYQPGDEFLLYIGCVGSYDTRSQEAAKALGSLLLDAGVSFGILGAEEKCDGNEVLRLGERELFQHLAQENIKALKDLQAKSIITLSPHSYNVMKNEYPELGADFEVIHYTQFLRDLIKNKKLKPAKGFKARVTYHDPCFLGRHNKEYDAPREVLSSIPGVELTEMESRREHSFCCGGGGGNFYTDMLGGAENSPSRIRIKEAYATGAEVLAVACPICMTMLDDAVKVEGLEDKLGVKDIAEIVRQAC